MDEDFVAQIVESYRRSGQESFGRFVYLALWNSHQKGGQVGPILFDVSDESLAKHCAHELRKLGTQESQKVGPDRFPRVEPRD